MAEDEGGIAVPRRRRSRIYTMRGRYYGDFRDFADVGGKREALVPKGATLATTDADVAESIAVARVKELEDRRRSGALLGAPKPKPATLQGFAAHHLVEKKKMGRVTDLWLADTEMHLRRAIGYFGAKRPLTTVSVDDISGYVAHLQRIQSRRGAGLSGGTVRHHLNALSNLYRRAQAEGRVLPGYNPVASLMEKPSARAEEAHWLEAHEAALLLEVARTYKPKRDDIAVPFAYPLLATFLLTGGRRAEVLGLEVADISFDRKTVMFRPNQWRRLKTRTSHRSVPLFSQLEEILRPYVFGADRPPGRLLFPSLVTGKEAMLREPRKFLDAIAVRGGWRAGEIRVKALRHSFTAAALQLLDRGAPISTYTVATWLGHGGETMVKRVYGHLGDVRHRAEVLEFRVSDFMQQQIRDGETVEALLRSLDEAQK